MMDKPFGYDFTELRVCKLDQNFTFKISHDVNYKNTRNVHYENVFSFHSFIYRNNNSGFSHRNYELSDKAYDFKDNFLDYLVKRQCQFWLVSASDHPLPYPMYGFGLVFLCDYLISELGKNSYIDCQVINFIKCVREHKKYHKYHYLLNEHYHYQNIKCGKIIAKTPYEHDMLSKSQIIEAIMNFQYGDLKRLVDEYRTEQEIASILK